MKEGGRRDNRRTLHASYDRDGALRLIQDDA
jgi:hypothetical protein